MIRRIHVQVAGATPLIMHRFPMVPVEAIEKKPPEEQADSAAYRTPSGQLYVPGVNIQRALISGATYCKGKGRGSLVKPAAACLMVSPEYCILDNQQYVIDARPVVIPATRGRVVRFRPRFEQWGFEFSLEFDDTLLRPTEVRQIVDHTGSRVGLLDFRPEKKGPFGRFSVVVWEPRNDPKREQSGQG